MDDLDKLAEVAVVAGANVQAGQVVQVTADVGQADVVEAVARSAYRHGARFVDVQFRLPGLQRALITDGPAEAYVPPWADAATRGLDDVEGARIMIVSPTAPGLLDDLDPALVDRAEPPRSSAWREVEYRVNSTIVPGPHHAWAQARYPHLDAKKASSALWRDLATALRLDATDAVQAWQRRFAELCDRARLLSARRFDAIRLTGPGTELTIGLLPGVRWEGPTNTSERGVSHAWNLPSEEIYTSPDPERVDGRVRLTRPAVVGGALVNDVSLSFRRGQLEKINGGDEVERLRAFAARDLGTKRVGELALVDDDSAVARVGQPFGLILLDENVASHLALGFGFPELSDARTNGLVNRSADHLDLTIGSSSVDAAGLVAPGSAETPIIQAGRWVLQPENPPL